MSAIVSLPIVQPRPVTTLVTTQEIGAVTVTGIARRWRHGDAARCRLCPPEQCGASGDTCLVLITSPIRDVDAPMYRLRT